MSLFLIKKEILPLNLDFCTLTKPYDASTDSSESH